MTSGARRLLLGSRPWVAEGLETLKPDTHTALSFSGARLCSAAPRAWRAGSSSAPSKGGVWGKVLLLLFWGGGGGAPETLRKFGPELCQP